MDVGYKPANLDEIVVNVDSLNEEREISIHVLWNKNMRLFDGILGVFNIHLIELGIG